MSLLPWATVVNQWTPSGLYQRVSADGVSNLLGTETEATRDSLVASVGISSMADFYRQKLIQIFRESFPDDLQTMRTAIERRTAALQEYQNYTRTVSGADETIAPTISTAGNFAAYPTGSSLLMANAGVFGFIQNVRPRLFLVQGPVTNALLVNEAESGEYLGVVSMSDGSAMPASLLYINRGTLEAPNWIAFDDDSLIDYIINPTELLECGYVRVMANLKAYAQDVPKGAGMEWSYTYMPNAIKAQLSAATAMENVAFALIRPSLDGTGLVTDDLRKGNKIRKWIF